MKELSIEEKAQRYDVAIEKSKILYEQGTITESLCYVFSELKESEDENIRKELIKFVKVNIPNEERYIAWLEKQGEQKSFARYKVGDTIYYNSFGRLVSFTIANIVEDGTNNPMYEDKDGNSVFQNDIIEQNPTDNIEQKFKKD